MQNCCTDRRASLTSKLRKITGCCGTTVGLQPCTCMSCGAAPWCHHSMACDSLHKQACYLRVDRLSKLCQQLQVGGYLRKSNFLT